MSLLEKVEKCLTSKDAVPFKGTFVKQACANIFSNKFGCNMFFRAG